jgi:hypothetical protein
VYCFRAVHGPLLPGLRDAAGVCMPGAAGLQGHHARGLCLGGARGSVHMCFSGIWSWDGCGAPPPSHWHVSSSGPGCVCQAAGLLGIRPWPPGRSAARRTLAHTALAAYHRSCLCLGAHPAATPACSYILGQYDPERERYTFPPMKCARVSFFFFFLFLPLARSGFE